MNLTRHLLSALCLVGALLWLPQAAAQAGAYSKNGADSCLDCHDEDEGNYKAAALFSTKHAHRNDKRSPFGPGGLQCEACHGPGAEHVRRKRSNTINTFKPDDVKYSLEERNQICMSCHEGGSRSPWHTGAHASADLACTDCHKIHRESDPVLTKASEAQVCMSCHTQQRADFQKASAHPVRQGQMACSDCHSAHGSTSKAMLKQPTLNQTCYSCHSDKRGPVLWEHAPVAEDCSLCHDPHGSVRPALLTKTPTLLCQQCHSAAGHPSVARTADSLPGSSLGGGSSGIFLVGSGCASCHTQVHGSNHPGGARLMR